MNTQEIINELTKYDRLSIREALSGVYSRRYIDYMFDNGRKRTELFRKVVRAYWSSKLGLTEKVDGFIHEFNNKKEEELV
ncbi:hypothetical protein [Parabacteroides distasonis]|uniref:hypothetical protein n=1 Tax=Parabacteroides distasonis TaxID=823 RepID=UPI00321AED56